MTTAMWWWYIVRVLQSCDTTCVNCNRGLDILYSQSGGLWNMPTSYFAIKIILTQIFVILLFYVRSPVKINHRLCFRKFCFVKGIFFRWHWLKHFSLFCLLLNPKKKSWCSCCLGIISWNQRSSFFAKEYWKVLKYLNIFTTQRNHILESRIQLYF